MFTKFRTAVQRFRGAPAILIGYNFFLPGGAWKSIYHYFTHLSLNGFEPILVSRMQQHSFRKLVMALLFGRHLVINGLDAFYRTEAILFCLIRRSVVIYLHETEYIFNSFKQAHPVRYFFVRQIIRRRRIGCVSRQQATLLRNRYGCLSTFVLYEAIQQPGSIQFDPSSKCILMVGTIERRKGVTLFSQVADLAAVRGLPWKFYWVGPHGFAADLLISSNVTWLGHQSDVNAYLRQADVFLLSSVDDPFPLACLEALALHRRCVVYRATGIAEILEGIGGCAVYSSHEPEAALAALSKAIGEPLDTEQVDRINRSISGIGAFSSRLNALLGNGLAPDQVRDRHGPVPVSSRASQPSRRQAASPAR
jgi:glycosyltransferase involved in cell wall biosynthesis